MTFLFGQQLSNQQLILLDIEGVFDGRDDPVAADDHVTWVWVTDPRREGEGAQGAAAVHHRHADSGLLNEVAHQVRWIVWVQGVDQQIFTLVG